MPRSQMRAQTITGTGRIVLMPENKTIASGTFSFHYQPLRQREFHLLLTLNALTNQEAAFWRTEDIRRYKFRFEGEASDGKPVRVQEVFLQRWPSTLETMDLLLQEFSIGTLKPSTSLAALAVNMPIDQVRKKKTIWSSPDISLSLERDRDYDAKLELVSVQVG